MISCRRSFARVLGGFATFAFLDGLVFAALFKGGTGFLENGYQIFVRLVGDISRRFE